MNLRTPLDHALYTTLQHARGVRVLEWHATTDDGAGPLHFTVSVHIIGRGQGYVDVPTRSKATEARKRAYAAETGIPVFTVWAAKGMVAVRRDLQAWLARFDASAATNDKQGPSRPQVF